MPKLSCSEQNSSSSEEVVLRKKTDVRVLMKFLDFNIQACQ